MNPRLAAFDQMLDKLATEWNTKSGKNNQYHFLATVQQVNYEKEYFAVDCFHMSPIGQSTMATRISEQVSPADWK
jgi:hypothetical protein